jgi:hypothetical protein
MSLKKEYIILPIIIIVLSIYLYVHKKDSTHYNLPEIKKIDIKNITKINILRSGKNFTINKNRDFWQVGEKKYRADNEKIADMINIIKDLSLTNLISESKTYSRFDLDKNKKIAVKAWIKEKKVRDFSIGKSAPTYQHTYITVNNDTNIYMAKGDLKRYFDYSVNQLRDKKVLTLVPDKIDKLTISQNKDKIEIIKTKVKVKEKEKAKVKEIMKSLSKNNKQLNLQDQIKDKVKDFVLLWTKKDGGELEQETITKLIKTISTLECNRYLDEKDIKKYSFPLNTIICSDMKKEYSLKIFKNINKESKELVGVSSEKRYPFLISEYSGNNLIKLIGNILSKPDDKKE